MSLVQKVRSAYLKLFGQPGVTDSYVAARKHDIESAGPFGSGPVHVDRDFKKP